MIIKPNLYSFAIEVERFNDLDDLTFEAAHILVKNTKQIEHCTSIRKLKTDML